MRQRPQKGRKAIDHRERAKAKALKALSSLAYSNARSVGKAGERSQSTFWILLDAFGHFTWLLSSSQDERVLAALCRAQLDFHPSMLEA